MTEVISSTRSVLPFTAKGTSDLVAAIAKDLVDRAEVVSAESSTSSSLGSGGTSASSVLSTCDFRALDKEARQEVLNNNVIEALASLAENTAELYRGIVAMREASEATGDAKKPFADFLSFAPAVLYPPRKKAFDATKKAVWPAVERAEKDFLGSDREGGFTAATLRGLLGYRQSPIEIMGLITAQETAPSQERARAAFAFMQLLLAMRTMSSGQLRARFALSKTPHVDLQDLLIEAYSRGNVASVLATDIPAPPGSARDWKVLDWVTSPDAGSLASNAAYRSGLRLSVDALVSAGSGAGVEIRNSSPDGRYSMFTVIVDPKSKRKLIFSEYTITADVLLYAGVVTDAHRAEHAASEKRRAVEEASLVRSYQAAIAEYGERDPLAAVRAGSSMAAQQLSAWVTREPSVRILRAYSEKSIELTSERIIALCKQASEAYRRRWPTSKRHLTIGDVTWLSAIKPFALNGPLLAKARAELQLEISKTAGAVVKSPTGDPVAAWAEVGFSVRRTVVAEGDNASVSVTREDDVKETVTVTPEAVKLEVVDDARLEVAVVLTEEPSTVGLDASVRDDYEQVRCLRDPSDQAADESGELSMSNSGHLTLHDASGPYDEEGADRCLATTVGDFAIVSDPGTSSGGDGEDEDGAAEWQQPQRVVARGRRRTTTVISRARPARGAKLPSGSAPLDAPAESPNVAMTYSERLFTALKKTPVWTEYVAEKRESYAMVYGTPDGLGEDVIMEELIQQTGLKLPIMTGYIPGVGVDEETYMARMKALVEAVNYQLHVRAQQRNNERFYRDLVTAVGEDDDDYIGFRDSDSMDESASDSDEDAFSDAPESDYDF